MIWTLSKLQNQIIALQSLLESKIEMALQEWNHFYLNYQIRPFVLQYLHPEWALVKLTRLSKDDMNFRDDIRYLNYKVKQLLCNLSTHASILPLATHTHEILLTQACIDVAFKSPGFWSFRLDTIKGYGSNFRTCHAHLKNAILLIIPLW